MKPSKQELCELRDQKWTMQQIGKKYKASKTTVCRWFKKYGIETVKVPRNKLSVSKELLIELYVFQGKSLKQIAKDLNMHEVTISKWFKNYHIDLRNSQKESPPRKELYDLYILQFKTLEEIAEIYDTCSATVSRWMHENNIEIRLYGRKVEIPTKHILERLYVVEMLTIKKIACFYNTNDSTVTRWLQSYNIPIKSNKRKYYHLKAIPFDDEQKEFIVGTLLGDGHLYRRKDAVRLNLTHSVKQADYFFWKRRLMKPYINDLNVFADKKRNSVRLSCCSCNHNGFMFYHKLFYDNKKKVVRDNIGQYLTPLGMAVWIMDDGWKMHNCNIKISSESFSKKENEILQNAIKINFDINCKVLEYTKNDQKYYYLSFNKRNSLLLTDLIESYMVSSMRYKLIDRSSTTKCKTSKIEVKPQFSNWREEWQELRKKYLGR